MKYSINATKNSLSYLSPEDFFWKIIDEMHLRIYPKIKSRLFGRIQFGQTPYGRMLIELKMTLLGNYK